MIIREAEKRGLKVHISVVGIHIKSAKSSWVLEEGRDGYWRLSHENYRGACHKNNAYHRHDTRYPNPVNAMDYIKAHDFVQYTKREKFQPKYTTMFSCLQNA